jgi:Mg-chelatase subunit ChlD
MEQQAVKDMLRRVFLGSAIRPDEMRRSALAVLGSLPLVANALVTAAGKRVQVVSGASGLAQTDGKTIKLMDLPIPSSQADIDTFVQMLSLAYGLVHHEVGHVNYTDFTSMPRAAANMTPLVHNLVGIIEDVRQENSQIKRCPASRAYLDALNATLQVTGHFAPVTGKAPAIQALTGYLLYRLYRDYRGDSTVADMVEPAEKVVRSKFPPGVLIRLDALLPRMRHLEDTDDALELAMDIADMLKDEQDKAQQAQLQAQQQAQAGASNPGAGSQDQAAGQDAAGQGGGSQDADSGQDANDASSQSQNGAGNGRGGKKAKGRQSNATPVATQRQIDNLQSVLDPANASRAFGDKAEDIARALQQLVNRVHREGAQGSMEIDTSILERPLDEIGTQAHRARQPYDMAQAISVTGRLRVKLIRQLQAATEEEVRVGKRGRKVSGRHLYRLGLNDPRIFRTLDEEQNLNTAIALMIDTSGSMAAGVAEGKPLIELASQALFATACAMESLEGVEVAIGTFPDFCVVKPFAVRARRMEAELSLNATGGTPMAHGIQLGQRLLQFSRKPRKLLITITDGDPNNRSETAMAIAAAEYAGIEVYGLGIVTDTGEGLFDRWQSIQSITDLPDTLMGLLSNRMIAQAA